MSEPNPTGRHGFMPGDSVSVIGQSVRMTIYHVFGEGDDELATCIWFDIKGRLQRACFLTKLLVYMLPSGAIVGQGQLR